MRREYDESDVQKIQEALDLVPENCSIRFIEVWNTDFDSIVVLVKDKEAIIISTFDCLYKDYVDEGFKTVTDA